MNKFSNFFGSTREEYTNFCVEFLGLFAWLMLKARADFPVGFTSSGKIDDYGLIKNVANRWEFGQIPVRFSWSLHTHIQDYPDKSIRFFTASEIKFLVDSLKNPFMKAHKGKIKLEKFYSSRAVLEFKVKVFGGLSDDEAIYVVDYWLNYFNKYLYEYFGTQPHFISQQVKANIGVLEKFISSNWNTKMKIPYRFYIYSICVNTNDQINRELNFLRARFVPTKYINFAKVMTLILTKNEDKNFTRIDKYKWVFFILSSLLGSKAEERQFRKALNFFPLGSEVAAKIFFENKGIFYTSVFSEEFEKAAAQTYDYPLEDNDPLGGSVCGLIAGSVDEYIDYMEGNWYAFMRESFAHLAFLEYCNEITNEDNFNGDVIGFNDLNVGVKNSG